MIAATIALSACLLSAFQAGTEIQPQPLGSGAKDDGINILVDSSHQFSFFHHWQVQDALRQAGIRSTGSQASLDRALKPGTPMRVRVQDDHAWDLERPVTTLPAPPFDVLLVYQHGAFQPFLSCETDAVSAFLEAGGGTVFDVSSPDAPAAALLRDYGAVLEGRTAEAAVKLRGRGLGPGIAAAGLPRDLRQAALSPEWTIEAGAGGGLGTVAWRKAGRGTLVLLTDARLLRGKSGGEDAAPLFERFGTTVGPAGRTSLPPIGPRKEGFDQRRS